MSDAVPPRTAIVVLGCTGVGKTDLAVHIAQRFNGVVVNADAMQVCNVQSRKPLDLDPSN